MWSIGYLIQSGVSKNCTQVEGIGEFSHQHDRGIVALQGLMKSMDIGMVLIPPIRLLFRRKSSRDGSIRQGREPDGLEHGNGTLGLTVPSVMLTTSRIR